MRTLLIEDEAIAARRTRQYLTKYGQGLQDAGWVQSVADANAWLDEHGDPDLIISDIELLDGNVFGLFDARLISAPVVFATAYDQFLLRAFETNGVGYLLKPYTYEQFAAAIDKVRGLVNQQGEPKAMQKETALGLSVSAIAQLQAALQQKHQHYRERFTIKRTSGITILPISDVAMLISEDKVAFALDVNGKKHPLSHSLNQMEEELDPKAWYRVSRGELVHLPFIERLEPYGRDRLAVHFRGLKETAVASRDKTPGLRKWLEG